MKILRATNLTGLIRTNLPRATKWMILSGTALILSFNASSQTAGNWNFNGSISGTAGSFLSVSAATLGSSIPANAFNSGTEYYGEGGWPSATFADPNAYMQFTLTANTGYYLVLNTLTLVQRRSSTGSPAGSGPTQWSVRSSLDNYTTDITTGTMTYNYATFTVTLPAAFQAIATGVTFRIYGYSSSISSGGTSRFVFDNISAQGHTIAGTLAEQSLRLSAKMLQTGGTALQWKAAGFAAGTALTLERSVDGVDFTPVDQQQTNSGDETSFEYQDASIVTVSGLYYRVAASEPDGSIFQSAIVSVRAPGTTGAGMKILGVNSQGGTVKAFLHADEAGAYQLSVWSQDGKPLYRQMMNGQAGEVIADVQLGNRPHGIYILTLSKDGQNSSRQFLF